MHILHEDALEDGGGNERRLVSGTKDERDEEGLHGILGKRRSRYDKVVPRLR